MAVQNMWVYTQIYNIASKQASLWTFFTAVAALFLLSSIGINRTRYAPAEAKTFLIAIDDQSPPNFHPLVDRRFFDAVVTIEPAVITDDSDAKITLKLLKVAPEPLLGRVDVGVESASFTVTPNAACSLSPQTGEIAHFIIRLYSR